MAQILVVVEAPNQPLELRALQLDIGSLPLPVVMSRSLHGRSPCQMGTTCATH